MTLFTPSAPRPEAARPVPSPRARPTVGGLPITAVRLVGAPVWSLSTRRWGSEGGHGGGSEEGNEARGWTPSGTVGAGRLIAPGEPGVAGPTFVPALQDGRAQPTPRGGRLQAAVELTRDTELILGAREVLLSGEALVLTSASARRGGAELLVGALLDPERAHELSEDLRPTPTRPADLTRGLLQAADGRDARDHAALDGLLMALQESGLSLQLCPLGWQRLSLLTLWSSPHMLHHRMEWRAATGKFCSPYGPFLSTPLLARTLLLDLLGIPDERCWAAVRAGDPALPELAPELHRPQRAAPEPAFTSLPEQGLGEGRALAMIGLNSWAMLERLLRRGQVQGCAPPPGRAEEPVALGPWQAQTAGFHESLKYSYSAQQLKMQGKAPGSVMAEGWDRQRLDPEWRLGSTGPYRRSPGEMTPLRHVLREAAGFQSALRALAEAGHPGLPALAGARAVSAWLAPA